MQVRWYIDGLTDIKRTIISASLAYHGPLVLGTANKRRIMHTRVGDKLSITAANVVPANTVGVLTLPDARATHGTKGTLGRFNGMK